MRWRHHCRRCGLLVCANCSRNKSRLSSAGYSGRHDSVRVCDKCFGVVHRENVLADDVVPTLQKGATFIKYGTIFTRQVRCAMSADMQRIEYWSPPEQPRRTAKDVKYVSIDGLISAFDMPGDSFRLMAHKPGMGAGQRSMVFEAMTHRTKQQWLSALQSLIEGRHLVTAAAGRVRRHRGSSSQNSYGSIDEPTSGEDSLRAASSAPRQLDQQRRIKQREHRARAKSRRESIAKKYGL